jgi:hypothetical protein
LKTESQNSKTKIEIKEKTEEQLVKHSRAVKRIYKNSPTPSKDLGIEKEKRSKQKGFTIYSIM